jgi:hypothetical protein
MTLLEDIPLTELALVVGAGRPKKSTRSAIDGGMIDFASGSHRFSIDSGMIDTTRRRHSTGLSAVDTGMIDSTGVTRTKPIDYGPFAPRNQPEP